MDSDTNGNGWKKMGMDMTTINIRHNFRLQTYRRTFTNYKKANWTQFTKDTELAFSQTTIPDDIHTANRIFTNIILLADKHNIPKGKMPSTSRLLPEHIVCKITQRDNIRRANPCDPALKPLNLEITSDMSLHKQNLWKEHLNANWDHRHNTHTLWKTIHGLSNRAAPTPQNCTITFNKKIATSPKNIVNCFNKQFTNTVKHSTHSYITQTPTQHGYKAQHSTVTALHTLNNTVAKGFNQMAPPARTITVALDMSKAFDTVNTHTLIGKLLQTSTPGTILKFVANYIKGCKAYTSFRNHKSIQRQVKTGVPQGGVLSPTLFNIHTADILTPTAPVQVMLYADDITITSTHTSMSAARKCIQPYLHKVYDWTQHNNLIINPLTGTTWGKQKETLVATYKAVMRPTLEYVLSI